MRLCKNCKWYMGDLNSDGNTVGRCHYYPTEGFVVSGGGLFSVDRIEWEFRRVLARDFCSKWTDEKEEIG